VCCHRWGEEGRFCLVEAEMVSQLLKMSGTGFFYRVLQLSRVFLGGEKCWILLLKEREQ
jgi:hypothetical protein